LVDESLPEYTIMLGFEFVVGSMGLLSVDAMTSVEDTTIL
jgi:hypothetical protein